MPDFHGTFLGMAKTKISFMARKPGRKGKTRVSFNANVKKPSAWSKTAKTGECKKVRNPRTGKTVRLCKTGRGRTGFVFRKLRG